ncbi:unnamed protein product [Caretta caretta]
MGVACIEDSQDQADCSQVITIANTWRSMEEVKKPNVAFLGWDDHQDTGTLVRTVGETMEKQEELFKLRRVASNVSCLNIRSNCMT